MASGWTHKLHFKLFFTFYSNQKQKSYVGVTYLNSCLSLCGVQGGRKRMGTGAYLLLKSFTIEWFIFSIDNLCPGS